MQPAVQSQTAWLQAPLLHLLTVPWAFSYLIKQQWAVAPDAISALLWVPGLPDCPCINLPNPPSPITVWGCPLATGHCWPSPGRMKIQGKPSATEGGVRWMSALSWLSGGVWGVLSLSERPRMVWPLLANNGTQLITGLPLSALSIYQATHNS